ncbi:MAG: hypothetical protein LUC22_03970 [Prevotella sp.]|nr:hypothetical protein [Prevotella sp.]
MQPADKHTDNETERNRGSEALLADILTDRPKRFTSGQWSFFIYPPTLGKTFILRRVIEQLGVNRALLERRPFGEALRLAKTNREGCALLIAYNTLRVKDDILDPQTVNARREQLSATLDDEDIAALLITCLTSDHTGAMAAYLKMDKEAERMKQVTAAKEKSNTYTFGGVSVYGGLIDAACERYGWTYDYVLWGISYTNLQLMLKDSIKSVYLTEKEAKRCRVPQHGVIDGNNLQLIMSLGRANSWNKKGVKR